MIALPKLIWQPSPNFSTRSSGVDLIVWHDCEGSYAGAVSWFGQRRSAVSAHFVVKEDGTEATQMVRYADKAWHACAANSRSIGVEMGGVAKRGFPDVEIKAAAAIIAYLLHRFKLPCRVAAGGVGAGYCRHFDLGSAGGGHHDPCTDTASWAKMQAAVDAAYKLGAPAAWPGER